MRPTKTCEELVTARKLIAEAKEEAEDNQEMDQSCVVS